MKKSNKDYRGKFEDEILKIVDHFYEIIATQASYVDLSLFYTNIKTLKIKEKKLFMSIGTADGNYNSLMNKISFINVKSLNHELLHVASTTRKKGQILVGFFRNVFGGAPIGRGLNEGYTSLLEKRYFNSMGSVGLELYFAFLIENIVGKKKMEQMYFKADLSGLLFELEKYDTIDNIIHFINNLDFLYLSGNKLHKNKNEKVCEECSLFCLRCLLEKDDLFFANGLISQEELNSHISEIMYSIYHINDWPIKFISFEKSMEMTREVIHYGKVEMDNVKQYMKRKSL